MHAHAQLLHLLKSQRMTGDWLESGVSEDNVHTALMALRLLLRDEGFQVSYLIYDSCLLMKVWTPNSVLLCVPMWVYMA